MDEEKQEEKKNVASLAVKEAMTNGALAALCLTFKEGEDSKIDLNIALTVRKGHTVMKMDLYALAKLIEVIAPRHINSMEKYRADFTDFIFSHADNEEEGENESTEENTEKEND